MDIKHCIAIAIREKRVQLGFELEKVSKKTNISVEKINEIENETTWALDSEINLICDVLNVKAIDLASSEIGRELATKISLLSNDKLKLIESAIDGLLISRN